MADVLDRLGPALLDASLAAAAIAGLVVAAMVQCRQPAHRRGWARAGLISTLALLPVAALNPVPRLDLRPSIRAILPAGLDGPPPPARNPRQPPGGRPGRPTIAGDHRGAADCPPTPTGDRHPIPSRARWAARGLVLSYLAGVSVGLGWMGLGFWASALLTRRARGPSAEALAAYQALPYEGREERPRLLVSSRATRPTLFGISRPTILIPPELERPDSAGRLRLGLLHELAHAESNDHRYGPAATLAQSIWFFLPPVWWIRARMRLDQEFLADRRAVSHFGTTGDYASSLVELARSQPTGPVGPGRAGPPPEGAGGASALFQRVLMLLKCPFEVEGRTPLWWRWATASTLAMATLAASCLTLRGMAGRSDLVPVPSAEVGRSFRLPQLVVGQDEDDDQPFDLRFRLPEEFALAFEVMAGPGGLPALEVLGHRLGTPDGGRPPSPDDRTWHRVRIVRSAGREEVLVDDRPVVDPARPTRPAPWLTIRPSPGQVARIRELELTW